MPHRLSSTLEAPTAEQELISSQALYEVFKGSGTQQDEESFAEYKRQAMERVSATGLEPIEAKINDLTDRAMRCEELEQEDIEALQESHMGIRYIDELADLNDRIKQRMTDTIRDHYGPELTHRLELARLDTTDLDQMLEVCYNTITSNLYYGGQATSPEQMDATMNHMIAYARQIHGR